MNRNSSSRLTISITNCVYCFRSSPPEVFLGKGVLKICSKFTEEHPCRSAISKKLLCNFIEIAFRHSCSPVNLLHIFRTSFPKSTPEGLLLLLYAWLYHNVAIAYQLSQLRKYFLHISLKSNCLLEYHHSLIQ